MLLDTNLLLRYVCPTDPAHSIATAAITSSQASGQALCIVPQNIYEFWVAATRPLANNGLGLTVAECQVQVNRLKQLFTFLTDQPTLYDEWEVLVIAHDCKGKLAHDARLVAAMTTHGIATLLTFNVSDFSRYPGITALDPATVTRPPTP